MKHLIWLFALVGIGQAACSYDPLTPLGSGVATKLAFVRQPAAGTVQRPLTVFEVAIQDTQGETVLPADNAITLTLGNNPGGAQLLGEVTVIASSGIASFAVVGLDKPAAGYTLVASAAGLASAISEPFTAAAPAFAVVSSGPFGGHISTIAISPAPSAGATTILAGAGNGVYRSLDHGATWTPASFGLLGAPSVLRADPKTPGVVYAVGGGSSLVKTTRNGDTWLDTDGARTLNSGAIDAAVDPMRPAIIYACGYDAALFRTADGGATWQKLTGFPLGCSHVTIDPIATSNVYALAYEGTNNRGVYRSRDSGVTWIPVNTGLTSPYTLDLLVATPGALFVGSGDALHRSTDGGDHWTPLAVDAASALAYAPSAPTRVYLGRPSQGVSISDDGGASFGPPVHIADIVGNLAVDPTNPNLVYAGGNLGMYVSSDGGVTWAFSSTGITAQDIRSVAMVPTIPDTVVAATTSGVYQTSDGGTSWVQASAVAFGTVRFDRTSPTRAFLCGNAAFSTSTSSGASFGPGAPVGTDCAQFAFAGTTLFAAGNQGTRKSINGGAEWTSTDIGATYSLSVALGDSLGSVVVTGTSKGIARSVNSGTSYTYVSSDYVGSLLSDPTMPTRVIAGLACGASSDGAQSSGGFRVSTDGGASFGGVRAGPCIQELSDNGSTLYASARDDPPYASTDHGDTWEKIDAHLLPGVVTNSIAASADGKTIYLGTSKGLYSTTGGL